MRLTTVQDNNMQQMIHKCCVSLGKSLDRLTAALDREFFILGSVA